MCCLAGERRQTDGEHANARSSRADGTNHITRLQNCGRPPASAASNSSFGMLETRDPSAAALHEVENVAAKLFIGGVEGKHLRDVIVLLQPPEARAGPVA